MHFLHNTQYRVIAWRANNINTQFLRVNDINTHCHSILRMEQRKQNWGKGCDGKSSSKFDKSEKWVNKVWKIVRKCNIQFAIFYKKDVLCTSNWSFCEFHSLFSRKTSTFTPSKASLCGQRQERMSWHEKPSTKWILLFCISYIIKTYIYVKGISYYP